jgi:hypothetical protein
MTTGIILTVIISWAIAFFGILQFVIYKRDSDVIAQTKLTESFSFLWLTIGSILIFTGFDHIAILISRYDLASYAITVEQILIGLTLVIGCWHVAQRIPLPEYIKISFLLIYVAGAVLFVYKFLQYGYSPITTSYFSVEVRINAQAGGIFSILFFPLFGVICYDLIRISKRMWKGFEWDSSQAIFELLSGLSVIILAIAGAADELSITFDWATDVSRLATLVGVMIAYFAITSLKKPQEELIV